jgi:uncharacterized protein YndB with AHSA1/START domain
MEPVTITRTVDLDTSLDELWALIADPEQLGSWLGDSVEIDLRPGGTGMVVDGDHQRQLRVDRIQTNHGLAFTWWEADDTSTQSHVVFEIGSGPYGGSRLTITETLVAKSAAEVEAARIGWEVRVLSLWACAVAAALVQ